MELFLYIFDNTNPVELRNINNYFNRKHTIVKLSLL